ncbi:GGDEF domain-containing protein [Acinetobacter rudis]|uniref:GGDEF domain-containing protein n=1 Tax=Acinetobacter rudis TaxID=632955 RepID=UPI0033428A5F
MYHYNQKNMIMNWSDLKKCCFILCLASFENSLWIMWRIFVENNPNYWIYIDIDFIRSFLFLDFTYLIIFLILILVCCFYRKNKLKQNTLKNFILLFITIYFLSDGYFLGIFSPVTIGVYVCFSGISLILFERKEIYFFILSSILFFIFLFLLIYNKILPYAPIFTTYGKEANLIDHPFVLATMAYFFLPMVLICFVVGNNLISQWYLRERKFKYLSEIDYLTKVFNRRAFFEKTKEIDELNYSIILMDLDNFKSINDIYGHSFGDQVLQTTADCISKIIRRGDLFARYGGEEFIILVRENNCNDVLSIVQRYQDRVRKLHFIYNNKKIFITASFGVCVSGENDNSLERKIISADKALYRAKQNGRDRIEVDVE